MNNINVYLRLLNSRRFAAGLHSSAASLRAFSAEAEMADTTFGKMAASGRLAESALYAIGTASKGIVVGLTAAAGTVGYFGVQFNATMESNNLAFEHFAGGVEESKKLVNDLFLIARDTPFEFTDITTAARRFLAFGFSVEEATSLLDTLGDTLAFTGGGTDEIFRLTKAFGDIRAKGRLMQQELNQLTNIGINPYEAMEKGGLFLTEQQLKNIGRSGIDADTAISALQKGLEETFGGGAAKYLETFSGQWNKLKDSFKQASGTATTGVFAFMKDALKFLNDNMDDVNAFLSSAAFKDAGNDVIQFFVGAWGVAKGAFKDFMDAIAPAKPFFDNILLPLLEGIAIGVIAGLVVSFKIGIAVIKVLANVLGFIGEKLAFLKPVFKIIGVIIGTVFGPIILRAIGWLSKFGGVFAFIGSIARIALIPFNLVFKAIGFIGGQLAWVSREIGFFLQHMRGIGPLVGVIVKVGAAIRKWFVGVFTTAVNLVARLAERLFGLGSTVVKFGARLGNWLFSGIRDTLFKVFTGLGAFAASIGRGIADWLNEKTPFGDKVDLGFVSFTIPALASGGLITSAGTALVGENGPELATFPRGTVVTPFRAAKARVNQPGSSMATPGVFEGGIKAHFTIPVMIGRRQVGEAMGEYLSDREIRS